jgi:stearoyl-CoA desaturase (Delta-9 desaturase)
MTQIQHAESHHVVKARLVISHLACLGVFFVPFTPELGVAAVLGYAWRVFAFEGAAHRYFSHKAFKTSRVMQALLGLMVAASGQRGPIWWAMHHRDHHRYSDTEQDVHSPVAHSFWQAHVGWLMRADTVDTDLAAVKDLARVPELVWINRWHMLFPLAVLVLTVLLGAYTPLFGRSGLGWAALVWAFFVPTVLALHAAFAVNTMTHGRRPGFFSQRRFDTGDTTTNSWLLAIPTLGASWHNNHHRCAYAARAGFYWWELDLTYLVLRGLQSLRLVWNLQTVPALVLQEGRERDEGLVGLPADVRALSEHRLGLQRQRPEVSAKPGSTKHGSTLLGSTEPAQRPTEVEQERAA